MSLRVLVVEDAPLQRRMLIRLLELCPGLEVCGHTGDGEIGLELALTQEPDVILLDPILMGRSGLSLLREYRKRGGEARVLALTGTSGHAAQEAILAAGADFVLVKPVPIGEIAEHIRLLQGRPQSKVAVRLGEVDGGAVSLKGREYAVLAAEELLKSPENSMKMVYLQIAREKNTDHRCVEKNIRSYIKYLYQLKKDPYRAALVQRFGETPPSNAVFLRLLAGSVKIP